MEEYSSSVVVLRMAIDETGMRRRVGSVLPGSHEGDFLGCLGGCGAGGADEDDDDDEAEAALIPSVKGEYGAATE